MSSCIVDSKSTSLKLEIHKYNSVTLAPLPDLPGHIIAALENAEKLNIMRLAGDPERLLDMVENSPLLACPQYTDKGHPRARRFHVFAGFKVLNLIRLLSADDRDKARVSIICFHNFPPERMIEFARVDTVAGSLGAQSSLSSVLEGTNARKPSNNLYVDLLKGYESA